MMTGFQFCSFFLFYNLLLDSCVILGIHAAITLLLAHAVFVTIAKTTHLIVLLTACDVVTKDICSYKKYIQYKIHPFSPVKLV